MSLAELLSSSKGDQRSASLSSGLDLEAIDFFGDCERLGFGPLDSRSNQNTKIGIINNRTYSANTSSLSHPSEIDIARRDLLFIVAH